MRPARGPALWLLLSALAAGCTAGLEPPQTQLQIRQYQTYEFDTPDSRLVLKSLFNVLQDDGYVVRNAVVELGLITATRETDLAPGQTAQAIFVYGGGRLGRPIEAPVPRKTEIRDFTGNVTEFGQRTRVRVSFQRKVLDGRGNLVEVTPVSDPLVYQDFFSRLDKGVYLQREQL